MMHDQDLTEFNEEFSRVFRNLHGKEPTDWNIAEFHRGLRGMLGALASVEINIYAVLPPNEMARHCAEVFLKALDRRADRAWSFNYHWRRAALIARTFAGGVADRRLTKRFEQAIEFAEAEEQVMHDKGFTP